MPDGTALIAVDSPAYVAGVGSLEGGDSLTAIYKAAAPSGRLSRAEWLELGVVLAVPVLVFVLLVPLMLLTPSKSPVAALAIPGGTLALSIALILGLRHAARHLVYRLDDEGLSICVGPVRKRIPYGAITGVRVESPPGSPGRIYGVDLPSFLWGRFTWKGTARSLALYATRRKPLLCIDTRLITYGVTPADQDAFVADLRKRIGDGGL